MTSDQAGRESSSTDAFDVFGSRIGSALARLLTRIDTCEQLLNQATQIRDTANISTQEALAAKQLSKEKRREIDREISRLAKEFPTLTEVAFDEWLSRMGEDAPGPPPGTNPHPLAPEEAGAALRFLMAEGLGRKIEARVAEFGNDEATRIYLSGQVRGAMREPAVEVQGAALLPEIVASFEQYLSSLIRTGLSKHPLGLGPLPDVKWEVASRLPDKEDLERYLIDQKVESFLRNNPPGWQAAIKRWTKIDLTSLGDRWDDVVEMVQRRHAIIHNGGRVDQNYLDAVDGTRTKGLQVGERLPCDLAYMRTVIRSVQVTAIVLGLRWVKHFATVNPLNVLPDIVDRVYALEQADAWSAAFEVADTALQTTDGGAQDEFLLVNWWLCRQQLGSEDESMRADIERWRPTDHELLAARHALLEEHEALAGVVRQLRARPGSTIRFRTLRDMPIFQRAMVQSAAVRSALSGRSTSSKGRRGRK